MMQFIDERNQKLINDLRGLIYSEPVSLKSYKMAQYKGDQNGIDFPDGAVWEEFSTENIWGGDNKTLWFAADIVIPSGYEGQCVVYELRTGREEFWDATNPQFSVFINGKRKQGLDVNHREVLLSEQARAGEVYHLVLSAFTGNSNFYLRLESEIKILHRKIEKYYYDLSVPFEVLALLDGSSREAIIISEAVTDSLNLLDLRKPYSELFYKSLILAQDNLKKEFYDRHCGQSKETIYAVGHTHIDVAWLWTLSVTRDKAVRSFSSAIELMRQYPEFCFMSSQPQLYKYVKEAAPEVFEEIKNKIKEGRWEAEGGMFLEADCNLSSGESLIRQFVFGKRFFREEFGVENEILWLPDVFGYSAALPQIMKKCGVKYFMTTKISWNETNKMPYDTFLWEGLDGTKILTHFISTRDYNASLIVEGKKRPPHFTTYNGNLNPTQVKGTWQRYSQKQLNNGALMCFGYGDGGGGPTREMLENQRRLALGIPGCPMTQICSAKDFFERLQADVSGKKGLSTWVGELYLEYHRGTYTSMARNKKYNRKAEFLLGNLESLDVLLSTVCGIKENHMDEINELWEILLRNQFHDILPGSSCKEVYEDSRREYAELHLRGNYLKEKMLDTMTRHINSKTGNIIVYNLNAFESTDVVTCEYPSGMKHPVVLSGNKVYPIQKINETEAIFVAAGIPSKGCRVFEMQEGTVQAGNGVVFNGETIETPFFQVDLNEVGQFVSFYDKKEGRELLKKGCSGNTLVTYEDRPHNYDAWDINDYYTEKEYGIESAADISVLENGPIRLVIRVRHKYLDSVIEQNLIFYSHLPRIDIVNRIDWNEKNILLRSYFPFEIHANEATYEIQYGNVKRPTHYNTSWDQAKFEVCAHKWIDISEDGYGVSIINDCKYGCDIHNGVVGLTMLKSAVYPNPDADKEYHEFSYSIYPHKGSWKTGGTVQRAYEFNNPLVARIKTEVNEHQVPCFSFVNTDCLNIIIEVLKPSDDGNGIVLRLYETFNRSCSTKLVFSGCIQEAFECNMLEEEEKNISFDSHVMILSMKPYEIKTIKVKINS